MPSPLPAAPARLVGLYSSRPGCGKSTAARALVSQGFSLVSFARPLRSMVFSLLLDLGYTSGDAFALLHERKEELVPQLGVSCRHLMRTLGTEWGRTCVSPTIWIETFKQQIAGLQRVVVDDVRFPNELEVIQQLGGELWHITRPGLERAIEHASDGALEADGALPYCTGVIVNSGNIDQFKARVQEAIAAAPALA